MKKILVLYTSVGLGHKSIAENIGFYLSEAGAKVKLADIGQVQTGKFEHIIVSLHQLINKYIPFLWQWLYDFGYYLVYPFRIFIAGFNFGAVNSLIKEFRPDMIITTQTTASAVVAYLKHKQLYTGKFGVAFSDFHLHKFWLYDQADFYLVNTEEQKEQMVILGIPLSKIFVCGITLKPKIEISISSVKENLEIPPEQKIVLVSSGSLGTGVDEELLKTLSDNIHIKIIVVCGKNKKLFDALTKNFADTNVKVLGYYQPMQKLYAIADLFLTKPGGLSIAEGLQYNLPMIITHTLPGQEKFNLKYLLSKKFVLQAEKNLQLQINNEILSKNFKTSLKLNPNLDNIAPIKPQIAKVVFGLLHT